MKRLYILLLIIGAVILLILSIGAIFYRTSPTTPFIPSFRPTPTPYMTPIPTIGYTSTNNDSTFNNRIDNRPSLAPTEQQAKQDLIATLPQGEETLYNDNTFKVTYVQPYDIFQVEILSTNVDAVETNVVAWFASKGISKESVCSLPVMFYPNFYIDQQLKTKGIEVPPLAKGC